MVERLSFPRRGSPGAAGPHRGAAGRTERAPQAPGGSHHPTTTDGAERHTRPPRRDRRAPPPGGRQRRDAARTPTGGRRAAESGGARVGPGPSRGSPRARLPRHTEGGRATPLRVFKPPRRNALGTWRGGDGTSALGRGEGASPPPNAGNRHRPRPGARTAALPTRDGGTPSRAGRQEAAEAVAAEAARPPAPPTGPGHLARGTPRKAPPRGPRPDDDHDDTHTPPRAPRTHTGAPRDCAAGRAPTGSARRRKRRAGGGSSAPHPTRKAARRNRPSGKPTHRGNTAGFLGRRRPPTGPPPPSPGSPPGHGTLTRKRRRGRAPRSSLLAQPLMILPQVHLRKPCYDFYFL